MMFTRPTGVQLVTALAATIGLASTGAVRANAAEAPDPLSAVTQATPQTVASAAAVPTTDAGVAAIDATVNSTRITVPVDPESGIQLGTTKGRVSVGLPFAASADDASAEKRGVVSYDNRNSSMTVPVVQSDGTVQVNTVIANESAPTRYDYRLTLPDGASLIHGDGGSVYAITGEGEVVATIAAPWAKDAVGTAVPTHYELRGTTLTQVVDHRGAGIVYPVVADPSIGVQWWGIIVKYNRAETKSIAAQASGTAAVALACAKVPSGAPAAACGLAAAIFTGTIVSITKSAVSQNKCLQINAPYVPIPPGLYVVTC